MRTLKHWIIASVVILGLALGGILSVIASQGGKTQTLRITPTAASGNAGGVYRPTAGHGPGAYTDSQLAQVYLEDGSFINHVTKVAIKRTTWGDISPHLQAFGTGMQIGGAPIDPNKVYDIIVQVGTVVPAAFGQGTNGPNPRNLNYSYVINVVDPNNLGPGSFMFSDPNLPWPSYWGQIHGQETDASH